MACMVCRRPSPGFAASLSSNASRSVAVDLVQHGLSSSTRMQTVSSHKKACKRRRVHTCTIWRSTSTSAPFSASSVNAIVVAVVIVGSPRNRLVGRTSTLSGSTVAAPDRESPPRRGKPLRASPYAPCRDERLTPLPGTSTKRAASPQARGRSEKASQFLEGSPFAAIVSAKMGRPESRRCVPPSSLPWSR